MAAGAVPILSALPCYRDLIAPGADGLLFDHRATNGHAALAADLRGLLTDPARRDALAYAARITARRFDYDAVAAELEADLRSLPAPR